MIRIRHASLLVGLLSMVAFGAQWSDKKPDKRNSDLQFTVLKESNGKPIRNAEVILHPVDKDGKQKQEGLELKTHEDGKTEANGIPYGKLRIQVIAQGFRTFGQDYVIDQPSHEITIKMQKPSDQFSIYK